MTRDSSTSLPIRCRLLIFAIWWSVQLLCVEYWRRMKIDRSMPIAQMLSQRFNEILMRWWYSRVFREHSALLPSLNLARKNSHGQLVYRKYRKISWYALFKKVLVSKHENNAPLKIVNRPRDGRLNFNSVAVIKVYTHWTKFYRDLESANVSPSSFYNQLI